MTKAENYEILGKTYRNISRAQNDSLAEEFDFDGNLEVLEFEDGSRLNVQSWTDMTSA